jgi:hypothetical protein
VTHKKESIMAEIQEFEEDSGSFDSLGELEVVEKQVEQPIEQPKVDDDLPRQFRGKSIKEIAEYAALTERSLSKQGQELGEVRRLADELLREQLVRKHEAVKTEDIDFFQDPEGAVNKAIENNPRLVAAENHFKELQIERTRKALMEKHPDVGNVMQDPEFAKWINSSKIRTNLFQHAENYDLDAADELLSTYKELRKTRQTQEPVDNTVERSSNLRSASVDTGGSGEITKKVYRRADLINLKIKQPSRYDAMADEIMKAYAEGRVR